MSVQYFQFRGKNRRIVVLLRSAEAPGGYTLVSSGGDQAQLLVDEISPHLAKDVNALGHARSLLRQVGITVTQQARLVAPKLKEAINRELLHVYGENPQDSIHYSTEEAAPKASSSSSAKTPAVKPSNQGKQASNAAQSGSASNHTPTDVPISEQACRSDPVSLLSGEEILPLVDFTYQGIVPITWRRLYRSSKIDNNLGMGYGWRHGFSVQLEAHYQPGPKVGPKQPGRHWFELHDEEGRRHVFEQVKPGQTSYQTATGLALFHQLDGKQILIRPDDSHWTFVKHSISASSNNGQASKNTHVSKTPAKEIWLLDNVSNHLGQSITLHYDQRQRLERLANGPKRGIALQYNQQNNLEKIAAYVLDDNNKRIIQSPLLAHYQYNDAQALVSATNSQQSTEQYRYRHDLLLSCRTRASGFSHHFLWQGEGSKAQCIEQWGDNNTYHYHFIYQASEANPAEQLSTSTDSLGHTERFIHNAQGLLTAYTNTNGATEYTDYDALGRKTKTTDAMGNSTIFAYNEQGQLCTVTNAQGNKTHYHYNGLGKRIVTIDALGQQHKRRYDATGRLLAVHSPDGRTHSYRYTEQGQLHSEVDFQGVETLYHWSIGGELLAKQVGSNLTRYSYDNLGRLNGEVNAQGLVTEYKRNRHGQVSQQNSYPQNAPEKKITTAYSYDQAERLLSVQTLSDEQHNTQTAQQADADITLYQYQGLSQPSKKTFSDGSWLSYGYDSERNLTDITRSDGATYKIAYSPTEKPVALIGFDGRAQCFTYDNNDQLISVNDSDLRFIRLKRDSVGNIIEQSASQATNSRNAQSKGQSNEQGKSQASQHNYFQYDAIGRLVRAHNSERTVSLTYHKNGKLSTSQQGHWSLNYDYNNLGQRSTLHLPDGSEIRYQYTKQGQLSDVSYVNKTHNASKPQSLVRYAYNNAGLNTQQNLGNGIELTQHHDVYSRLTEQLWQANEHHTHIAAAFSEYRRYQYDHKHQLTLCEQAPEKTTEPSQNQNSALIQPVQKTFTYNSISQLLQSSVINQADEKAQTSQATQYHWDAFGNPQSTANNAQATDKAVSNNGSRNAGNGQNDILVINDQLHRFAGNDYRFDECGNQISCLGKGNKQQRVYNGFNQLTQLSHNGKLTHYEYDALGRRSAKITEQGRIDFIWDNNQLIGEHHNGKFTWFIYQPDTFLPVALINNGQVYYYHLDQLGTPICLTDSTGQQVWRNESDVFGCQLSSKENEPQPFINTLENPLRFQGQYFDEESNLHYNRFRYYDPKQQRFINQDPIGLVGGINQYQYAPNPVNWIDPLGLSCKEGTDSGLPEEEGLKPVTLLPVEWAIEGLADAAEQLAQMLDTGPTLAGAAAMAISLIPGKVADKALEPVVKKLDGVGNVATQAAKKTINRKTPDDFPEFSSMNHKKAAAGEYNAHQLMVEKGFTPVGKTDGKYKPGQQGIDGIYNHPNPPPDFVITEAKYNTARLGKTKDGKQMSNKWVNDERLRKAGMNEEQRDDIIDALRNNDGTVQKLLIRNKPDGSLVVKELGSDAKKISKPLGL